MGFPRACAWAYHSNTKIDMSSISLFLHSFSQCNQPRAIGTDIKAVLWGERQRIGECRLGVWDTTFRCLLWLPNDRQGLEHGLKVELCCLTSKLKRFNILWNYGLNYGLKLTLSCVQFESFSGQLKVYLFRTTLPIIYLLRNHRINCVETVEFQFFLGHFKMPNWAKYRYYFIDLSTGMGKASCKKDWSRTQ